MQLVRLKDLIEGPVEHLFGGLIGVLSDSTPHVQPNDVLNGFLNGLFKHRYATRSPMVVEQVVDVLPDEG
ncbi:hypothetical protein D3C71_1867360 [compost metagenome]